MNEDTALAVIVCVGLVSFFLFMGSIIVFGSTPNDIAIACVQSGGEWKSPGTFSSNECVRERRP